MDLYVYDGFGGMGTIQLQHFDLLSASIAIEVNRLDHELYGFQMDFSFGGHSKLCG